MATPKTQTAENENSETRVTKRIKLEHENVLVNSNLQSFRGFKLIRVLNENAQAKNIAVHGE